MRNPLPHAYLARTFPTAEQAAGSSLLVKLTNLLAADALGEAGLGEVGGGRQEGEG